MNESSHIGPLVLGVACAAAVLWFQARWIVSSALRAMDAQSAWVLRLEAAVLEQWSERLRRALTRAAEMGLSPLPPLLNEVDEHLSRLARVSKGASLFGEARVSAAISPETAGTLLSAFEAMNHVEGKFLNLLRGCSWSVDRHSGVLVETVRFRRRWEVLRLLQMKVAAERESLRSNRLLRLLILV